MELSFLHYDYLEKTLIKRFEQNHLNLDNKNSGNTSPISEQDKQACELFLSNVIITLENIFNIKLFSLEKNVFLCSTAIYSECLSAN